MDMGISIETLERGLCATDAWGLITQEHALRDSVPQRDADPPAASRDRRRYSLAPLKINQIQAPETSWGLGGGIGYWMKRLMLWTAVYHAEIAAGSSRNRAVDLGRRGMKSHCAVMKVF